MNRSHDLAWYVRAFAERLTPQGAVGSLWGVGLRYKGVAAGFTLDYRTGTDLYA